VVTASRNGAFPHDARCAALLYLEWGLAPIPLHPRSKKAVDDDFLKLRLTPENVDHYFPAGGEQNIGVLTGQASRRVVDVDLDSQQARTAADILLPVTGAVFGRPGKPCSHRLYRVTGASPRSCSYRSPAGETVVELRSDRLQTMVPPSVHPSGERVEWDTFDAPGECLTPDLEIAVARVAAAALLAKSWPAQGSRQDAALALAGALGRGGWSVDDLERFIEAVATAAHDTEVRLRVRTARRTTTKIEEGAAATGWPTLAPLVGDNVVHSVRRWLGIQGEHTPEMWPEPIPLGSVPEAPPFPLDVFPDVLQRFISEAAAALPSPPDYLAVPLLGMAGGMIGASRAVAIKNKHVQRAVLYTGVVGPPGSAKTPALEAVTEPIGDVEEQLQAKYEAELAQYERDKEEYEQGKKEAKAKHQPQPEKPKAPVLQRYTVDDCTVEVLVPILKENPRGVVQVCDELVAWVQRMNCYREGGKGADRQFYLSAWSGKDYVNDRKTDRDAGKPPVRLRRPFVGVVGGLVPDNLPILRGDRARQRITQDGHLDRLLLSYPKEPEATGENWADISEEATRVLANVFARLAQLQMVPYQNGPVVLGWRPYLVRLSPKAKDVWQRFTQQLADDRNAEDFPPHLRGPWAKFRGYCGRLALIVHFLRWACGDFEDDRADVDEVSMSRAVKLIDYFKGHARKVYGLLDADPRVADARHVKNWLEAHWQLEVFSRRDVHQGLRNNTRFENPENLDAPLMLLDEYGYIRPIESHIQRRPGRPGTIRYARNPLWSHPQYPQNPQDDLAGPATPARTPGFEDIEDIEHMPDEDSGESPPPKSGPACPQDPQNTSQAGHREARSPRPPGENSDSASYQVIWDTAGLATLRTALEETAMVGLDLETTGLNPRTDRVRLVSLSVDTVGGGRFSYLVDCFAVDPAPLREALADKELVIHNAPFDLAFLARLGLTPAGIVNDTMLLAQLLVAGTHDRVNLADCCDRWLGRRLDKAEQKSDWSGPLTSEQLAYAAADVDTLAPLFDVLTAKVKEAGLSKVADIERRALSGVVWTARHGVAFNRDIWTALADAAGKESDRLRRELDSAAPTRPGSLARWDPWNWDSPQQVKEALALAGCEVADTTDETLATLDDPVAMLLRQYRAESKKVKTYGAGWLSHVADDGRVYPGWRQIGAWSGRMSCSEPSMQQLPRGEYRRCIVAPPGRVLVKADYSQIELRIAAKVSGDKALLDAYRRGEDLHTLTARTVLGVAEVTKKDRQLAKALNFGLLYGMGAKGFRVYARTNYGVELTDAEARNYRSAFFRSYPGLAQWHRRAGQTGDRAIETCTLAGRRRLDVKHFTEKLNTPVQGTGADGFKAALALLWERRHEVAGAFPVLLVHDEIVIEADVGQAEAAGAWLKQAMADAMAPLIDPVPVEVEVKVAPTWGGE
jgi:DNA polymerase-1